MKESLKVIAACLVLVLMALGLLYLNALPPEENLGDDPWVQDDPIDENQDIDEPPLTWAEAHCAPKYYHPPEALVPDRWHPANILTGAKP